MQKQVGKETKLAESSTFGSNLVKEISQKSFRLHYETADRPLCLEQSLILFLLSLIQVYNVHISPCFILRNYPHSPFTLHIKNIPLK